MRLIDLRCHWFRQYYPELTGYDQSSDADVKGRLGELDGYLSDTSAAILLCGRAPSDWALVADPWHMLGEQIARYQAEFSGRVFMGPDDLDRWQAEPKDFLCWGLIGVGGFDFLIRSPTDLDHLPTVFNRGARLFQAVATSNSHLGGSSEPGDDRGLTDLGRLFLERLTELTQATESASPRPILDLAGMSSKTMADSLDWLESDSTRRDRLVVAVSRAAVAHPGSLEDPTALISVENAQRLRALGAVIGLGIGAPLVSTTEELAAQIGFLESIPFQGRQGPSGIAIGSDFLGGFPPIHTFKNAEAIITWITRTFDPVTARRIAFENGRDLIRSAVATAAS